MLEYPKLRQVSLEGRFVKLKPENVEVHWGHKPWKVRSFEIWSYSWSRVAGYTASGNSLEVVEDPLPKRPPSMFNLLMDSSCKPAIRIIMAI